MDSDVVIQAPRDRLAGLLAEAGERMAFSAGRTAPPGDLQLEVRGVGPIRLPVTQTQARQLSLIGRPARYGRGEQTLLDRRVRDTWEIPKSRIRIDKRRFNRTLQPILDRLGRDLGLAPQRALQAEFHSMLVYAPGQFFAEHQDSEKDDAMIGSLVVSLPSTFTGGALEVRHGGETATYRGSKKSLSFAAFYGDCRHEVKPVRSGYRIVLTYNLLARETPDVPAGDPDPGLVGSLAGCLDEHFTASGDCDRLVYLLDHEYTARGLGWARLKGRDAQRVTLLRAAAERAGCELALALTNVHEIWSAFENDNRRGWSSRRSRWDDEWQDDEVDVWDGDGGGDYDLQELIDSEVTLDGWIDPGSSRFTTITLSAGPGEICASTPSGDLEPYDSEYEGYMGNYGNTLERWYHRGAVILWPQDRAFTVRAEASPSWALDELTARARSGDQAWAGQAAAAVTPFWNRVATQVEAKGFFAKAMRTARVIDDPHAAGTLLRPFRLEQLTPAHAKALGATIDHYGHAWTGDLIAAWSANRPYHRDGPSTAAWIASLPRLCKALRETGEPGTDAAALLLHQAWAWLSDSLKRSAQTPTPSSREHALSALGAPAAGIIEAASLLDETDLRTQVVGMLGDSELICCALAALRATPAPRWHPAGLAPVANHCATTLKARLDRSPRARDDWSVELAQGCDCELCDQLRAFLADPARREFEWPLAKDRRTHIHRRIDTAELPVRHQTRRTGRPYTLVLTKTDALFEHEREQRHRDKSDLAWLERNHDRDARATRRAERPRS